MVFPIIKSEILKKKMIVSNRFVITETQIPSKGEIFISIKAPNNLD